MKQSRRKQQDGHQDAAWGAHSIDLVFLLLALPFFLFCHAAPGAPEEAGPAAAMGSAAPSPVPDEKVVYGTDDRREVYETTDASHRAWAASTCALVSAADLTGNNNGTYTLKTTSYLYSGRPACSDEPYGRQPVAPFCSGFMAGDDIIVTAGHCINENDLDDTRFLFGFDMADAATPVLTFDSNQVYTGVTIIARSYTQEYDYCVVRLDRVINAPGAHALPLRETDTIEVGQQVGVIGHPAGLPKKIAFGGETRVRKNAARGYFYANVDTYGGNSGSPVFNAADGFVEGVLVRGNTDFVLSGDCFRSNTLQDDYESPEQVSKSATFAGYVYGTNTPPENDLFIHAALFPQAANQVSGSSQYATREPDEPEHAGKPGGASLWWYWTAPRSGGVVFSTEGSTADTLLAVYTGSSLAGLNTVASNDDMPNSRQSQVSFQAVQDTRYYIAVDGYDGAQGTVLLALAPLLSVTPGTQTVGANGGTTRFTVETTASWTAASDQSWASLNTAAGDGNAVVTITYALNSGEERNAVITVTGQETSPPWTAVLLIQEPDSSACCCTTGIQKGINATLQHLIGDGLLLGMSMVALWAFSRPGGRRFRK